jgi:N4-gp56 family major capsid protein
MKNKELKLRFNLQFFADYEPNATTDSGMSAEMKTFYDKQLITLAEPELIHDQFGQKKPIPKNGGKTVEFRKYDSLEKATTPLVEGVTPKGSKMNTSTITSTVNQYGDFVALTDMLILTAIDNNVVEANKLLGSQAGRTLDTITRDVLAGGTNVMYAGDKDSRAKLTTKDKLTVDMCFRVAAFLKAMNAPKIDGSYVALIHPYVAYDIMSSEQWLDVQKYSNVTNIFEGEIGKIAGIRFCETSEAKIWKGTDDNTPDDNTAVFSTLVVGEGAYGVTDIEGGGLQSIIKQLGAGDDPLNQRATSGWKATKTAERLVEQYMVRIESCSEVYSSLVDAN